MKAQNKRKESALVRSVGRRTYLAWYRIQWNEYKYSARWNSLEAFVEDMGEAPEGCALVRLDKKLPYCKKNCRWISNSQRFLGNSSPNLVWNNRPIKHRDAARLFGVSESYFAVKAKRKGITAQEVLDRLAAKLPPAELNLLHLATLPASSSEANNL